METQNNRKKWAEALRSGEYKKGSGLLKCNNYPELETRHCPWGVGCEVYIQENKDTFYWTHNDVNKVFYFGSFDHNILTVPTYTFPPREVVEFFGMSKHDMHHIVDMSDEGILTFEGVANYVENFEESDHEFEW